MCYFNKIINSNILFFFVSLILLINLGSKVYSYREEYFIKYDSEYWKDRYLRSQWVAPSGCNWDPHINPKTCVWDDAWYVSHPTANYKPVERESIGDDGLYAYVGWEYIQGKDPTLLNAEMPPLGKYLIGLSILIFKNQNIFALFSGILAIFGYLLLNKQIFKNKLFIILPVVLFSFEPLFYEQLRAPFLDLLYLSFLFFIFYFILKEKFIMSTIFIGLMMSVKASFGTFVTVVAAIIIYFLIRRKLKLIKKFLILLPISILTFALTYLRFFLLGHSVNEFLGVQKWILNFYYQGAKADFGGVWEMLLFGKWSTWWDKTTSVAEWRIIWPIIFLLSLLSLFIIVKNRKLNNSMLFLIWIFVYLLFLSTLPVFPRYLLLVLPFLYTLSIWVISERVFKKHLI